MKKHTIPAKLWSWLLALVMILSLVPGLSLTAYAAPTCPNPGCRSTNVEPFLDTWECQDCGYIFNWVSGDDEPEDSAEDGPLVGTVIKVGDTLTLDGDYIEVMPGMNDQATDSFKLVKMEYDDYFNGWGAVFEETGAFLIAGDETPEPDGFYVSGGNGTQSHPYTLALHYASAEPAPSAYAGYVPAATDDATALAAKVVKFNGYDWYLIEDNSTSETEGTVTLFAKDTIGSSRFDNSNNVYSGSMVKSYLDKLTAEGGAFADVADAIVSTDLEDVTVTGAKLWLLSKDEVITTYKLSTALNKCSNDWWLRTPATSSYLIYVNGESGSVVNSGNFHMNTYGVRPALKLDLSKVEFDSATKTFAVKPTVIEYRLWVGDVQITSANMDDVLGDKDSGATVTFTPATTGENPTPATLTLKGATVTDYFAGVCVRYGVNDTLVINLEGDNTIGSDSEDGLYTGLETRGSLIIQGNGKLAVKGRYNGIMCDGDITIESGEITASGLNSGIQSGNENGITLNGGKVTAKGNTGIAGYGGVTIAGADVNAEGVNYAIFTADKDITISAGTVNATATGAGTWQKALNGTVKNSIYGTGWTDSSGTEGKTAIATSTTGQDLSDYKKVIFVSHTHNFTYSASGATITAMCGNDGCDLTDGKVSFTLVAPAAGEAGLVYDGTDKKATLEGVDAFNTATGLNVSADDIVYNDLTNVVTETKNAGTYQALYTLQTDFPRPFVGITFTVAKANPTCTAPTGLTATYGQTLKDVTLPTGWAWADGTQSVGNMGTNTFKANFTPADTANYNTVSGVDVTVTVGKAAGKAAVISTDTMSYSDDSIYIEGVVGQEYIIVPKGAKVTDADWNTSVKPDPERDNWVFFENLKEATEYEIYARTAETETAFASDAVKANVYTTLSSIGYLYDSTLVGASITVEPEPETEGLTYKWYQDEVTEDDEGALHHALTEIPGATGPSYTFRAEDVGKHIAVKIFAGDSEVGDVVTGGPVAATGTVIFESMGGSEIEPLTGIAYQGKVDAPADPVRQGYVFEGWYLWYYEGEYDEPWDFDKNTVMWTETTLYAKWTSVDYSITSVTGLTGSGEDQWTKGGKDGAVITVKLTGAEDDSFERFVGVKLDGKELVRDVDYTVAKGSTVVTLKPETLEKLSVGKHTVTILFNNGQVDTPLTVLEPNAPQTGDSSLLTLWMALAALSPLAIAALLVYGKKKKTHVK